MIPIEKLAGHWKGQYHDSFGWDCRLELHIGGSDLDWKGSATVEIVSMHHVNRISFNFRVLEDNEFVAFSLLSDETVDDFGGKALLARGIYVDTKGYYGIAAIYGFTNPFQLGKFGGGAWVIWKLS